MPIDSSSGSLIDIGANLTNGAFRDDLAAVIARARSVRLAAIVVTGTTVEISEAASGLAAEHPDFLYATAGVHPHHASDWSEASALALSQLLREVRVVAVGECGLDFERNYSPPDAQRSCFRRQLELACDVGKPLFLHCRGAHRPFLEMLDQFRGRLPKVVVHCFTEGVDEARAYVERGWHIGITGWIADEKRGGALREAVRQIPLHRLLVETDAPYLVPLNKPDARRRDRNEPAFLPWVAKKLAECRKQEESLIAHATTRTSLEFFDLAGPAQLADIYNYREVTGRMSTSGQPNEAQLAAVAREGFAVVVNLALHNEPRYSLADETGVVRSLGMEYAHIPVQFDKPTQSDLLAFFSTMEQHRDRKVFVHCAANMRVSAFVGLYRSIVEHLPDEQAFSVMKTIWEPNEVWSRFIAEMLAASRT
ncbi:MAG: hypothetical protein C5B46_07640 [Proteobacteria bacterium]|nr:MAG: hypothetical protein C5B46_07640 [Pseudomonadota bacterium]